MSAKFGFYARHRIDIQLGPYSMSMGPWIHRSNIHNLGILNRQSSAERQNTFDWLQFNRQFWYFVLLCRSALLCRFNIPQNLVHHQCYIFYTSSVLYCLGHSELLSLFVFENGFIGEWNGTQIALFYFFGFPGIHHHHRQNGCRPQRPLYLYRRV